MIIVKGGQRVNDSYFFESDEEENDDDGISLYSDQEIIENIKNDLVERIGVHISELKDEFQSKLENNGSLNSLPQRRDSSGEPLWTFNASKTKTDDDLSNSLLIDKVKENIEILRSRLETMDEKEISKLEDYFEGFHWDINVRLEESTQYKVCEECGDPFPLSKIYSDSQPDVCSDCEDDDWDDDEYWDDEEDDDWDEDGWDDDDDDYDMWDDDL